MKEPLYLFSHAFERLIKGKVVTFNVHSNLCLNPGDTHDVRELHAPLMYMQGIAVFQTTRMCKVRVLGYGKCSPLLPSYSYSVTVLPLLQDKSISNRFGNIIAPVNYSTDERRFPIILPVINWRTYDVFSLRTIFIDKEIVFRPGSKLNLKLTPLLSPAERLNTILISGRSLKVAVLDIEQSFSVKNISVATVEPLANLE